jgi:tRNA-dihydrouridine synthase A
MVGLFHGVAGARQWRQILSTQSVQPGADGAVLREALRAVTKACRAAA